MYPSMSLFRKTGMTGRETPVPVLKMRKQISVASRSIKYKEEPSTLQTVNV
jgi:hypothetical protein